MNRRVASRCRWCIHSICTDRNPLGCAHLCSYPESAVSHSSAHLCGCFSSMHQVRILAAKLSGCEFESASHLCRTRLRTNILSDRPRTPSRDDGLLLLLLIYPSFPPLLIIVLIGCQTGSPGPVDGGPRLRDGNVHRRGDRPHLPQGPRGRSGRLRPHDQAGQGRTGQGSGEILGCLPQLFTSCTVLASSCPGLP